MISQPPQPPIPPHTWSRPIGLGWDKPYTVRYNSNLDDGPWHGMPLGGFGAGCIGRSPRGDFNLWHLDGGEHVFQNLPACQFSVYEEADNRTQAYALCTEPPEDGTLKSWNWYPSRVSDAEGAFGGTYRALYPRSWYVYENVFSAQITCEQFSPILPHNYQETSYPLAIFEWTIHNPTDRPITISVMLTWENIVGWFTNAIKSPKVQVRDDGSPVYEYQSCWGESEGNFNRWSEDFSRLGCVMNGRQLGQELEEGQGQIAIATITNPIVEVFYHTAWNPAGDGDEIWQHFATDGSLPDFENETPARAGERIATAIAVRTTIRPGKTRKIPFILAWDFPITEFAAGIKYYRRYTDFFGRSGQNTGSMIRTALKHSDTWKEEIQAWQQPILEDEELPDGLKMALFNELYDLTSGGTLWTGVDEAHPIGQFGVLECFDYRWYESLDVRLYGSFALLRFWPNIEKSVMRSFAAAISKSDDTPRVTGYNQAPAIRKAEGATPHDLGAANEHPWVQTNYTSYQDCNLWKDLPCDFVLQVYRDFYLTGSKDYEFLRECWSAIVMALDYLKTFDVDGDGIPENGGAPDQTFDDWKLQGISAYCGGLWLAGLEAAIAIGTVLLEHPQSSSFEVAAAISTPSAAEIETSIATYQTWLQQAKPLYQNTLWNGRYYRLDSQSGSDVVMADQICGQFYARLLGLEDIIAPDCARSALQTVYEACFVKFNQNLPSAIGAANGVRLDGSPENPNATHPLEVWTGINFGLSAFLLQMGMKEEGLKLASAIVSQTYTNGLQFRTPEAITAAGTFRASHYLRAMAIWAIYGELRGY